jgi:hypothetical protein
VDSLKIAGMTHSLAIEASVSDFAVALHVLRFEAGSAFGPATAPKGGRMDLTSYVPRVILGK